MGVSQTWQLREIGWKESPEMHLRAKQKNVMTIIWMVFCWEWRGKPCDEYEEHSIMMWLSGNLMAEENKSKGIGHYQHLNIHQLTKYNTVNKLPLALRPAVTYNSHLFAQTNYGKNVKFLLNSGPCPGSLWENSSWTTPKSYQKISHKLNNVSKSACLCAIVLSHFI